ncbi:MAG: PIG-L family deacetylase [candidate division WS1 bacterium]|jgi:LmbE family N-acetylglucosaminyl deacetylase|nr:PIG-L family deacetylase [candidate division WS1 bacterium]
MTLNSENVEIYIPDGTPDAEALGRTTHMSIAAHQDDIEIMAYHGILECFRQPGRWFTGVVVTDGAGSPRSGVYADYTDEMMKGVRKREQRKAAVVGDYAAAVLLGYPSSVAKDPGRDDVVEDIMELLEECQPEYLYIHNLADKHPTHIACAIRTIDALRRLGYGPRLKGFYGCEIWRDLDWLPDEGKIVFDVSPHDNIAMALVSVFDSQITGGKRYDLATMGRRHANATYYESHGTDVATAVINAMDLMPLLDDPSLSPEEFLNAQLDGFARSVLGRLKGVL